MINIKEIVKQKLPTDYELNRLDILLLSNHVHEYTTDCLAHIVNNTDIPYKITFLDTSRFTKGLLAHMSNKLAFESSCKYFAFVCTDALVPPGWASALLNPIINDKSIAISTPYITKSGTYSAITPNSGLLESDWYNTSISISVYDTAIFRKLGGFDEDFYLYGHDTAYLKKVKDAGYKILLNTDIIAEHPVGTTTRKLFTLEEIEAVNIYMREQFGLKKM